MKRFSISRFGRSRARGLSVAGVLAVVAGLAAGAPAQPAEAPERDSLNRRIGPDELVPLAFEKVSVPDLVPFIAEVTGKVVLPHEETFISRITILSDEPVPRARALDMVFLALHQQNVAVIETDDLIMLRLLDEVSRQDVPLIGPETSVLDRTDQGTFYQKVYALRYAGAENMGEILKENLPDYAQLAVDTDSNQVAIMGNVGLLQRVERLIASLDQPAAAALKTETFHLRYADAEQIAENIEELFSEDGARSSSSSGARGGGTSRGGGASDRNARLQAFFNRGGGGGAEQQAGAAASTSANLRVTANTQQNSVTVLAEQDVLDQVRALVTGSWDKPLPEEAVIPRVYDLANSDPIKVRDLLEELFGESTTGTGQQTSQGVGRLAGQFSFEAIPDAGRLVVISKSPDHLAIIDRIIQDLDQPMTAGLPRIVPLKHASAEELAEQLNTLLAQEGTLAQLPRQATGLSDDSSSASPFAADQNQQTQDADAGTELYAFWWQRAQPPTEYAGSSNLVGKIRLVPVWRQNAVLVMAPPEYQSSVVELIEELDRPGRQVLIRAIILEMAIEDATALGIRWSSQTLTPNRPDNSIGLSSDFTGTKNELINALFDTSVLNVGADLNVLLQALNEETDIKILSEPQIFTSDNQEAEFFDGQDIPFVTDSQNTDQGNVIQSFDYRAVGIQLRVRPRITPNRQVDVQVNLELSTIQPEQTLFGGFIVDRRETTTHTIVQDGQTIVISGILRNEESDVLRKVPLLGDLPLLGGLFQSRETVNARTELFAFITPIVVENAAEADRINEAPRRRLDDLREEVGGRGDDGEEVGGPDA